MDGRPGSRSHRSRAPEPQGPTPELAPVGTRPAAPDRRARRRRKLLAPLHKAWTLRPLAAHFGCDVCVHILHRIADAALLHSDIGARGVIEKTAIRSEERR